MVWVMMFLLLFGGSAVPEFSLIPKEMALRKALNDPQRLEQVLKIRDEMKATEQVLLDAIESRYASLVLLSPQHDADADQFRVIFVDLEQARLNAQAVMLDNRFRLKEQMTAKEWKKVYGSR